MGTFLFSEIVFGPVRSRRLGVSLGINLLPLRRKLCNFDCIYCECGWNRPACEVAEKLPSRSAVREALEKRLAQMQQEGEKPDVITYAGNGEPTIHPEFAGIIDDSITLRDRFFPEARIAVLSNSTTVTRPAVKEALLKVDMNILKLDSAFDDTIAALNQPNGSANAQKLIRDLASFEGRLIIQTLFVRGSFRGKTVDNTTPREIEAWLEALRQIRPREVMIYTISRDIPDGSELVAIPKNELRRIASLVGELGISTLVSA